eukprot:3981321-Amphidinium_carterae.1
MKEHWLKFPGQWRHMVENFVGRRFSIAFFIPQSAHRLKPHLPELRRLGFPADEAWDLIDKGHSIAEVWPAEVRPLSQAEDGEPQKRLRRRAAEDKWKH